MKVSFIACFLGAAVAHASADATLRASSPTDSEPVADPWTYWNERAAEAAFMQVAISEGFTHGQCVRGCNVDDFTGNRKRCRRDCDELDNRGATTNDRTASCLTCDDFPFGKNKWVRCMNACESRRSTAEGICEDATDSAECKLFCIGGSFAREDCLDYFDGGNGSRRGRSRGRSRIGGYKSPSSPSRGRDKNRGRRSRSDRNNSPDSKCFTARNCKNCQRWCTGGSDFNDCIIQNNLRNCDAEALATE